MVLWAYRMHVPQHVCWLFGESQKKFCTIQKFEKKKLHYRTTESSCGNFDNTAENVMPKIPKVPLMNRKNKTKNKNVLPKIIPPNGRYDTLKAVKRTLLKNFRQNSKKKMLLIR